MTYPFSVGSAAFVELGDGGAHDPQIRFEADDGSCKWNGFPVCIDAEQLDCSTAPTDPATTSQIADWSTAATAGPQSPGEAIWPVLRAYNYLEAVLCGYRLWGRMTLTVSSGRGSFGIANPYSGLAYSYGDTGPAVVDIDTGLVDLRGPTCDQVPSSDVVTFGIVWANFNPLVGDGVIHGRFSAQWVANTGPIATYKPFQPFTVQWRPPCDIDSGLYVALGTDGCGALTTTYTNVKDSVNALSLGVTASILGGHGSDIAKPDPSCPAPDYCCDMAGAECSGSIDN